MAVISIQYDEPNGDSYKSVKVRYSNGETKFDSGDFVKDWFDLVKYCVLNIEDESMAYSSSVDHFIMDGAPYESRYLKSIDDDHSLEKDYGGIEFFIEEGKEYTWEELKERCK